MEAHCRNAELIARWLDAHPAINKVNYPGLASHPNHDVAARQMSGFGGMISIEVESEARAVHLVEHTQLFFLAESLGGVESLIEMPLPMTHASTAGSNLEVTPELVRISVGIEHVDDLIADLEQALG